MTFVIAISMILSVAALTLLTYRLLWRRRYGPPRVSGDHAPVSGRVVAPGQPGDVVLAARRGRVTEDVWFQIERDGDEPGRRTTVQVEGEFVSARLRELRVGDRLTMHAVDLPLRGEGHYRELPVWWGLSALRIARGSWPRLRWLGALTMLLLAGAFTSAWTAHRASARRGICAAGARQIGSVYQGILWCVRRRSHADKQSQPTVKDGPMRAWHREGVLRLEGQYRAGHKFGEWTSYRSSGQIHAVRRFDERGTLRWMRRYSVDLAFEQRAFDAAGRPHGPWVTRGSDGVMWKRQHFVHGLRHGLLETRDLHGRLTRREHWRRGELDGVRLLWRRGVLVERSHHALGQRHGLSTKWRDNGSIEQRGSYDSAFRVGTWRYWYSSGRLRARGTYERGRLHGAWQGWHPSGRRSVKAMYVAGERTEYALSLERPARQRVVR